MNNTEEKYTVCPRCGKKVSSKFRFCTNCRHVLSRKEGIRGSANKKDVIIAVCIVVILSIIVGVTCNFSIFTNNEISGQTEDMYTAEHQTQEPEQTPEEQYSNRGTAEAIPESIRAFMTGRSMTANDTIGFDDLAYLTIPYWDFSDARQEGHMVVAADLAEEVLDIFAEFYDIKYPIERMELVDYFFDKQTDVLNSPDRASMGNNNTSAFYYRVVNGTDTLSNHALGRAIDINTKINPFVSSDGEYVSPANAEKYMDRSCSGWTDVEKRAFIGSNTEIYKIFIRHGWEWGGEIWSYKDYQHFQKP